MGLNLKSSFIFNFELMKKFLLRLFLFFVLVNAILFAVKLGTDYFLHKSTDPLFSAWNEIQHLKKSPELLVIGNSKAATHYNPALMDSVTGLISYNLGMDGLTSIQQEERYKYYRQFNNKPKVFLLNMENVMYYYRDDIIQPQQYLPFLDDTLISDQCLSMGMNPLRIYTPQFRYFEADICFEAAFKQIVGLPDNEQFRRNKGFLGISPDFNEEAYKKLVDSKPAALINIELMLRHERFLKSLTNDGIKVIMVFPPQYSDYSIHIQELGVLRAYFRNLSLRLGVEYWDYTESDISDNKSNFFDHHHMNLEASNRYSLEISKRIKNMMIK
jgi:hypothetical protein